RAGQRAGLSGPAGAPGAVGRHRRPERGVPGQRHGRGSGRVRRAAGHRTGGHRTGGQPRAGPAGPRRPPRPGRRATRPPPPPPRRPAAAAAPATSTAAARLDALTAAWGRDWQADWLGGLLALAGERPQAALEAFERVRAVLPGEPAPKLALGMCAELLGRTGDAARWYDLVSTTDPACTTASAGLGRMRAAAGDRAGA